MKFGEVLDGLKSGARFMRPSFPSPSYIILLPAEHVRFVLKESAHDGTRFEYIALYVGNGTYKVFYPDTDDMFATDWERY